MSPQAVSAAAATPSRLVAALNGVAAGASVIGLSTLLAGAGVRLGWLSGAAAPLTAVGQSFINLTPGWLKDWAIATFGTHDKTALAVGIGLVLLIGCAGVGLLAAHPSKGGRGRPRPAWVVVGVLGVVGLLAIATRPGARAVDLLPTVAGLALGALVLRAVSSPLRSTAPTPERRAEELAASRRKVLGLSLGLTALGVVAAVGGQVLGATRARLEAASQSIRRLLRAPVVPEGAQAAAPGVVPFLTPNESFYRIDTAFVPPVVDPTTWRLRVLGMVDREIELTLDDLLTKPMTEAMVTLSCVSNPVGGELAGNAVWTGWPVRELLALAGVHDEADMVLSRSVDGFTASTPIEALTDDRDSLLAIGMNGAPLPVDHGFPARLVVPGLYGYVSATKWVTELKVTRFADDVAYWTTRGWSDRAPIKTASRFDVPRWGASVPAGPMVLAGVAWAQQRGIAKVEVSIDWQPWQTAQLASEPTVDAWRQWWLDWEATPGAHTLMVRAVDGNGEMQDVTERRPDPDGATGHHTIKFTVT